MTKDWAYMIKCYDVTKEMPYKADDKPICGSGADYVLSGFRKHSKAVEYLKSNDFYREEINNIHYEVLSDVFDDICNCRTIKMIIHFDAPINDSFSIRHYRIVPYPFYYE